jgi:hypothetical protein
VKKLVYWALKTFWFPILLSILSALAKKHGWAEQAHKALSRAKR